MGACLPFGRVCNLRIYTLQLVGGGENLNLLTRRATEGGGRTHGVVRRDLFERDVRVPARARTLPVHDVRARDPPCTRQHRVNHARTSPRISKSKGKYAPMDEMTDTSGPNSGVDSEIGWMWRPEDSGLPESFPRRSASLSWSAICRSCALKKTTPRSETRRARSRSCSSESGALRIVLNCVDGSAGVDRQIAYRLSERGGRDGVGGNKVWD